MISKHFSDGITDIFHRKDATVCRLQFSYRLSPLVKLLLLYLRILFTFFLGFDDAATEELIHFKIGVQAEWCFVNAAFSADVNAIWYTVEQLSQLVLLLLDCFNL